MILLAVVVAAVVAAVPLIALGTRTAGPIETPQHWFVAHVPRRFRRFVEHLDRRVAGGVAIAIGFGAVVVAALVVGALLDSVDRGRFAAWDEAAAEWGSARATSTSTAILNALTHLGGTIGLVLIMSVIGVAIGVRRTSVGPPAYLAVVGVGIAALNSTLKLVIDRERPDIDPLVGFTGSSFPSGHSAAAAACWAGIALVLGSGARRPVRWALGITAVALGVTVAATRVLLGVHWLSDVIAGVMVGWAWWVVVTLAFGGRWLRLGTISPGAVATAIRSDGPPGEPRAASCDRQRATAAPDRARLAATGRPATRAEPTRGGR